LGNAPPAGRSRPSVEQGGLRADRAARAVNRDVAARVAAHRHWREAPGALPVRVRARSGKPRRARQRSRRVRTVRSRG
jgi:hypothetical protein